MIDGLVLSGGEDVFLAHYREEPEEIKKCNRTRDKWEIKLFKEAYKKGLPIFGICRGMQLMNVVLGGRR